MGEFEILKISFFHNCLPHQLWSFEPVWPQNPFQNFKQFTMNFTNQLHMQQVQ
jgi:hypothetical protein